MPNENIESNSNCNGTVVLATNLELFAIYVYAPFRHRNL